MSTLHFVFKRTNEDQVAEAYASVYLPEVISAKYINEGRLLHITLQHQFELSIPAGNNSNVPAFFAMLEQFSL